MVKRISTSDLKESLGEDLRWIDDQIAFFQTIPSDQLKYKPAEKVWSAEECLAHMSILYAIYIRNMQKAIARAEKRMLKPTLFYTPGLIGNWFTNYMEPESKEQVGKSMRTAKIFDPVRNYHSDKTPIYNFMSYQDEFRILWEQIPELNLDKVRVKSSLGNIIRFKLGDCYRFITAHNKRHIVQALNTIKHHNG